VLLHTILTKSDSVGLGGDASGPGTGGKCSLQALERETGDAPVRRIDTLLITNVAMVAPLLVDRSPTTL
jgi:hypothetical protein